jgi:hypothetical protein
MFSCCVIFVHHDLLFLEMKMKRKNFSLAAIEKINPHAKNRFYLQSKLPEFLAPQFAAIEWNQIQLC